MIIKHDEIHGWMDYESIYTKAIQRARAGGILVEVGSWFGRSAAFMCEGIRNTPKPLAFFACDTWKGSPTEAEHQRVVAECGGDMFTAFQANMKHWRGLYIPLRMTSLEAADLFLDGSLDFVFLDAGHDYDSVRADIAAWLPKVVPGGALAGHDFAGWADVRKAVCEALPGFNVEGSSWIYPKPTVAAATLANENQKCVHNVALASDCPECRHASRPAPKKYG